MQRYECVDAGDFTSITKGKIYEGWINPEDKEWLKVYKNNSEQKSYYWAYRFKKVKEVPMVDTTKIKKYQLTVSVYDNHTLKPTVKELQTTYFKSDFPRVAFWDKVMEIGKKWGDSERLIRLMDMELNTLESCTIQPKDK